MVELRAVAPDPHAPAFLVTIDTEGDDLWGRPRVITTRNARHVQRFQRLCESFGLRPTWLTNFEMARCPEFLAFGRGVLRRGTGEIGMHLHAWNSPPLQPLTPDDLTAQPFLTEYPADVVDAKIGYMARLLRDRFECEIVSHRGGRWALDATCAQSLVRHGIGVDCSVTPDVRWVRAPTQEEKRPDAAVVDYRGFPTRPYVVDLNEPQRPGRSSLLEVPMTVVPSSLYRWLPQAYAVPLVRRWSWAWQPTHHWLYPDGRNLPAMLGIVRQAVAERWPHLEMVLHSSELMPGGSPNFPDGPSIEALYRDLRVLFRSVAGHFRGMTLGDFAAHWQAVAPQTSPASAAAPHTTITGARA
ncbi:MAG: deacetylase [Rubrivivax sp.]